MVPRPRCSAWRALFALPALLTALSLGGCLHGRHPTALTEPVTLNVENHNWLDITIYLMPGGSGRLRVGQVTGVSKATFTLTPAMLGGTGEVYLVADPIGSNQSVTERVLVHGGQIIEWVLEANLGSSTIAVWEPGLSPHPT